MRKNKNPPEKHFKWKLLKMERRNDYKNSSKHEKQMCTISMHYMIQID